MKSSPKLLVTSILENNNLSLELRSERKIKKHNRTWKGRNPLALQ